MAAIVLAGCGNATADKDNQKQETKNIYNETTGNIKVPDAGIILNIPDEYQEKGIEVTDTDKDGNGNISLGIMWNYKPAIEKLLKEIEEIPEEDITEEMQQDIFNKMGIHSKVLLQIMLVEEQEYKKSMDENISFSEQEWEEYQLKAKGLQALKKIWKKSV